MYQEHNLFVSYKHIESKSAKELEKMMLTIQVKSKMPINFSTPVYNQETKKYETWYLYDYSKEVRAKDKINLNNKGS